MSRIELSHTVQDIVVKLSDGNAGAVTVMMKVLQEACEIDPDDAFCGVSALMQLDELEVYGEHIWILFKHCCGENLVNMLAVLRARQLGYVTTDALIRAIKTDTGHGTPIDVEPLYKQVLAQLPRFNGGRVKS